MREAFITKAFSASSLETISAANDIIRVYRAQGYTLTLRQLYYQFVARGLLGNTQQNYKRLGAIVSDGRLAGLIDWEAIEDRTRSIEKVATWRDPSAIMDVVASQYRTDLWAGQRYRPEVWIEKEALVGVVEPICTELRLTYFACRGYASQSAQYESAQRFRSMLRNGQEPVVLHFGDHDPSGIDMTRENREKIELLTGAPIEFRRMALNMDQVDQYDPPPNPAKQTDSRFAGYQEAYGDESWELDALEPSVIADIIRREVATLRDEDSWAAREAEEDEERELLERASENWHEVAGFLRDL